MDEIFQKLLASNILTEDTRKELAEAFQQQVDEAVEQARKEATEAVTQSIHENWINERNTLIEALDARSTELMATELAELAEDIGRFRDLEAEFAQNLVEAKQQLSETLKSDMQQLIEKIDTFLEVELTKELEEMRDDIQVVRQQGFGKDIFEAFVATYKKFHQSTEHELETQLDESNQRLAEAQAALEEAQSQAAKLERSIKMANVLAPLSGKAREVMEAILGNVQTSRLEEAYSTYVGRVLSESTKPAPTTQQPPAPLNESAAPARTPLQGRVVNGDNVQQLQEHAAEDARNQPAISTDLARIRALAGVR